MAAFDSICKKRGLTLSTAHDGMLTQLLTKIDGVNELPNIFIIAMTNRKDMLDDALIRSGRIEVHFYINLPDIKGRLQILQVHSKCLAENSSFDPDIDLEDIAEKTENFTGAELESLIRSATNYAIHKSLIDKIPENEICVTRQDVIEAFNSITPQFGNKGNSILTLPSNYDITYFKRIHDTMPSDVKSFLLFGCRKTSFLIYVLQQSTIKYTKLITAEDLVKFGEDGKNNFLLEVYSNALLCNNSLILIDDLELIINYTKISNTISYSSKLFLTIQTMLRKSPNKNVTIMGTTRCYEIFEEYFDMNVCLE